MGCCCEQCLGASDATPLCADCAWRLVGSAVDAGDEERQQRLSAAAPLPASEPEAVSVGRAVFRTRCHSDAVVELLAYAYANGLTWHRLVE